jgi:hypothetical protein
MNAADIHAAIMRDIFRPGAWVYLREFRAGTGWGANANRYLDAWAIQPWPSSGMGIVGIEIKTSRPDWMRELKGPMKRDPALRISNQFYFAAPHCMLVESEIPTECGLIEVWADGTAHITAEAPWRECLPTWPFVASLARRVAELTAHVTAP